MVTSLASADERRASARAGRLAARGRDVRGVRTGGARARHAGGPADSGIALAGLCAALGAVGTGAAARAAGCVRFRLAYPGVVDATGARFGIRRGCRFGRSASVGSGDARAVRGAPARAIGDGRVEVDRGTGAAGGESGRTSVRRDARRYAAGCDRGWRRLVCAVGLKTGVVRADVWAALGYRGFGRDVLRGLGIGRRRLELGPEVAGVRNRFVRKYREGCAPAANENQGQNRASHAKSVHLAAALRKASTVQVGAR